MLAVLLLLAAPSLFAQAVSARLEGIVSDANQAIVPGASVVATNVATNITYKTTTNETGRYVFVTLTPGRYTVTVSLSGFKQAIREGIELQVRDAVTINFTLEPGSVNETVSVTAEAPLLDQTTAKVGAVVDNRQATELPLQDRNALMLYYLAPGVNPIFRLGGQQQVGGVDGLAPHTGNTKVEGVFSSWTSFDNSPADIGISVPQEAVGEYRITTSGATADTGRGSGAQVSISLKSGTNKFHGSLFEFNRNEAYNANTFFNNRAGVKRPPYRRNQFGGSIGGPIIKNRTFFFFTLEFDRLKQSSEQNHFVYTQTLRDGIFRFNTQGPNSTASVDAQGNPRVPFGAINLLTVDPTRQGKDTFFVPKLLAVLPLPNNYDIGDGFNLAGYRFIAPVNQPTNQLLFKIDHKLSDRHQLAVSAERSLQTLPFNFLVTNKPMEIISFYKRGLQARLVSTFSSRLVNELSVGGNLARFKADLQTGQETPTGAIFLNGLGTSNVTGGNLFEFGRGLQRNPNVNLGFSDSLTWIKGNHTLGFGGEMWYQTLNINTGAGGWPTIQTDNGSNPANVPALAGLNSTDRARAQQLTNDLTGAIGSISQSFFLNNKTGYTAYEPAYDPAHVTESSFYVQDIWKIRRNLSLELGLRYELLPWAHEANGIYIQPVGGVAGALGIQGPTRQPTSFGLTEGGRALIRTDKNNFAPRVGFSWDPFGKGTTVISGSYRIAYDRLMLATQLLISRGSFGKTTSTVLTPFTRLSNPNLYTSILPIPVPTAFAPKDFDRIGRAYVAESDLATPYVQSWSLRIAQQMFGNWKFEAAYVGNHAVGQPQAINLNQIEMRKNGFLDAFIIAQRNLAQNGNPTQGQSLGNLTALFNLVPSSQYVLITQGQAAGLANFLDTTTLVTGKRGGLITRAGLPDTFFRFNPQVFDLNVVGNSGHSTYNALKLSVTKRLSGGLSLQGSYTFDSNFTNFIPGQLLTADYRDNANQKLDKAVSPFDARHVVIASGIYELPVGRGKRFLNQAPKVPKLVDVLLGGWQLNGIYNWTTGRPLFITTGRTNLSINTGSTPNFSGQPFDLSQPFDNGTSITTLTPAQKAQFSNPGPGEAGGLPKYSFRGPSFSNLDLSLFKSFRPIASREGLQVQFRVELYNVFNQVNFGNPDVNINSPSFGVVTAAFPARIGQLALKVIF
ncbi:MAG: TonB-dependent receptor [Blastocatellia bacterium]